MKILYVLNSASPGGMEQHVLDLVKSMRGFGYEIFVWCPQGQMTEQFVSAGAVVTVEKVTFDVAR